MSKRHKEPSYAPLDTCMGEMCEIEVGRLIVPSEGELGYQREAVPGHAEKIAQQFNWRLFGALDVVRRMDKNGRLEIADGGNRYRAVTLRGDIAKVPCIIHDVNSDEDAAATFTGININRRNLAFADKYKAKLIEKDYHFLRADSLFAMINKDGPIFRSKRILVRFSTNEKMYKAALRLIPTIRDLASTLINKRHVSSDFVSGLVYLETKMATQGDTLLEPKYVKRMHKVGLDQLSDFAAVDRTDAGRHPPKFAAILASKHRIYVTPNPFGVDKYKDDDLV